MTKMQSFCFVISVFGLVGNILCLMIIGSREFVTENNAMIAVCALLCADIVLVSVDASMTVQMYQSSMVEDMSFNNLGK